MIELSIGEIALLSLCLVLIEGFFAGSEIALLSADKLILKQKAKNGDPGAKLALRISQTPERILSTTLLLTSFCVVSNSTLIFLYCMQLELREADWIAALVTTPLVVLFGELLPKMIYQRHANRLAPRVAYPIIWCYWLLIPITYFLAVYTNRLSRWAGPIGAFLTGHPKTIREEIRSILAHTPKESGIANIERQMIRRIFDFKDTEAKHALIPLVQVEAVEETAQVIEALELFERHRHSRMPVYSERIDNIVGVLEISDLLAAAELQRPIKAYLSSARYVSETQPLKDLIVEMREDENEMVIVVDEHGGAVGILTFEDIIEEIVGEISDEFDFDDQPYKQISDHAWSVQAAMEIQQINELLKLELPEGDYETLSGFLLKQFGRIPESRDELFFDTQAGSFRFTIQKATERHIETVVIQKLMTSPESSLQ